MLSYAFIDWTSPVHVPERQVNGGLYMGEAAKGAWGSVPVVPEAHILSTQTILSANPPKGAISQPGSQERPGNNRVTHPYHGSVPGMSSLYAVR